MRKGFTLIEILITVAIVTIISTGAILSLVNFLSHQNLESAQGQIAALLRNAQEKSASQELDSRWGVYINNTQSPAYYSLFQVNEAVLASSSLSAAPGTILDQASLRSNIIFTSPTAGTNIAIIFSKISGTPNASTSITLQLASASSSQKAVIISSNGKIDAP